MKTALLTLLLTGFGLWAQTPSFAPLPSGAPPDSLGTNRDRILQQALQRAIAAGTNTAAPATTANPVKAPAGADWSAPPPVVPNTPGPLPAGTPDDSAVPAVSVAPSTLVMPTNALTPPRQPPPPWRNRLLPCRSPRVSADGSAGLGTNRDQLPQGGRAECYGWPHECCSGRSRHRCKVPRLQPRRLRCRPPRPATRALPGQNPTTLLSPTLRPRGLRRRPGRQGRQRRPPNPPAPSLLRRAPRPPRSKNRCRRA